MDLFELKRIADKLLAGFPWRKHGRIGVHIQSSSIRVSGSSEAVTVVMHSDILSDLEKELLIYEITDSDIIVD